MRAAPGTRIDRFELLAELGRGGMGVVYHARDTASGQQVALKLLTRVEPRRLLRFVREGEISASLRHPGIVAVHAAGASEGLAWLAFELVAGARTLDEASAGLPLARRLELVRDAARALGHAHARGVVHRDVKPANLLVGADYRVRVADFGVALGCDLERLTTSGALIGTPLYMAPELLHGRRDEVGPQADVWALGVLLYETACGRPPFDASTLTALLDAVTHPPPRPRAVAPDVARGLEAVILRAMALDPADRHPDGEALALDLDRFLDGEEIAPVVGPRARGRSSWWVAGGALALLCAAGVAVHLLTPAPRLEPPRVVGPAVVAPAAPAVDVAVDVAPVSTALRRGTEPLMDEADAAYLSGRMTDALALYSEVLDLDPSDYRAWVNRSAVHMHRKDRAAAIADSTRALALDATKFEPWHTRGVAYFLTGERDLALRDLDQAVVLAPDDPEVRLHRARVRLALDQVDLAREDLDHALTVDDHHVDSLEERAQLRKEQGDLAGARSDLDRALAVTGPRAEMLVNRAAICAQQDDHEAAVVDLTAAFAVRPSEDVLLRRARALYTLRRLPEALSDADEALARWGTLESYSVRAGIRLGARDFEGALADATEALRRGSKEPMDHAHRGLALGSLGRRGEAVPDLTAAIDAGMQDLQLWQCRGFGFDQLGRHEDALADFDHVLAAAPTDFGALYGRGRTRRLLGRDLEGAVVDLDQAIALQPDNGSLYLERGTVHEALGQTAAAVADLRQVARLLPQGHPHRREAERRLAYLVP
jgi:serine/threonine-protein kinase